MIDAFFVPRSVQELRIKALEREVESLKSGSAYEKLRAELRSCNGTIESLHQEIDRLHKELEKNRNQWMQVNEDLHDENQRSLAAKDREIEKLKQELSEEKLKHEETKTELEKERKARYALEEELRRVREEKARVDAQVHRDHTTSSKSSSMFPNHPKQSNNRNPSGKKPGAQPGHEHHPRHLCDSPDKVFVLPPKEECLDPTRYRATGLFKRKQLVSCYLSVVVTEYQAEIFREIGTGNIVYADFPFGLTQDVTYDGSVKAMIYALNNTCNVGIDKTIQFLSEASHGRLEPSKGFVNKTTEKFAELSKKEQEDAFHALASAPVFHVDFTFGRCNGKASTVAVVCSEEAAWFDLKEKKGKEGVKGTPAEVNQGVCVSDHEAVLTQLGSKHQECLEHTGRYSKDSVKNEPHLTWNDLYYKWTREVIQYRDGMSDDEELDPVICNRLIERFFTILEIGRQEYAKYPPSKEGYRDGYNLWKRMSEKPEDYILTLQDKRVPPTNNAAEREGRKHKRKIHQVMTYRSKRVYRAYTQGLTVTENFRRQGKNIQDSCAEVFNRELPGYEEYLQQNKGNK